MSEIPILESKRLLLRSLTLDDAPRIKTLLQDPEIAANGLGVRYPYELSDAVQMIQRSLKGPEKNHFTWGVVVKETQELIGIITIILTPEHHHGEIGYWIGKAHWNKGYATEAAHLLINDAFTRYDLHRIYAKTFTKNKASVRVIEKLGMSYEGLMREHLWHELSGEYKDVYVYSLLKSEY